MSDTCVAGSGLSVVDGALTLDTSVMAPVFLGSASLPADSQTFGTSSPGNFVRSSTSATIVNVLDVPVAPLALVRVGPAAVGLSAMNQGYLSVETAWDTPTAGTAPRFMLGANNDNGTYTSWLTTYNYFTQTDVESSGTDIMLAPPEPVMAPGDQWMLRLVIRWATVQWSSRATGYDSSLYARYPRVEAQVTGFPQPA